MAKLLLVARYEFWRHVIRRGFLWAVLGIPLILVLVAGGAIWFFGAKAQDPVGVVDLSGLMMPPEAYVPVDRDASPLQAFSTEAEARAALDAGQVQAYFLVPPDFAATHQVSMVHNGDIYEQIVPHFNDYVRSSLLRSVDPRVGRLLRGGNLDITFVPLSGDENLANPLGTVVPFLLGFVMALGIFTSAGYLVQAVVDEKENRTMEILVTSVSPLQLMGGKIVGLVGLGLTQIAIWLLIAGIALSIAAARIANFPTIRLDPSVAVVALLWFVPFYLIIAGLMTTIGISVTAASEGQQAVGIVSILSMFPLWLYTAYLNAPDSPLAVALTLFPLSAPLTVLSRWTLTQIPWWQLLASWLLLAATGLGSVLLVGKVLQLGMFRYGQRLKLREVVLALAGGGTRGGTRGGTGGGTGGGK